MLKDLFKKNEKYGTVKPSSVDEGHKPNIPSGLWMKCEKCGSIIYKDDLRENLYVCNVCNHHLRLKALTRIEYLLDKGSFIKMGEEIRTKNPIDFEGYEEKLKKSKKATTSSEAVVTGVGKINGITVAIGVMDSYFMMGSMGVVVGERLTQLIEYATLKRLPLIIFTTSGGARMQEGIFSLMQMAKISAALGRHDQEGLLYITILTNPTTGGVTASFAMEGDIILSEPQALVGFAGRRVIENTIKESLPEDFQTAEFLLDKGFIDAIVNRKDMRRALYKLLLMHEVNGNG